MNREQSLEMQVKVLSDRLAIAIAGVDDRELDEFFENYQRRDVPQGWLTMKDEVSEDLRGRWRKTLGYKAAKHRIGGMLAEMARTLAA